MSKVIKIAILLMFVFTNSFSQSNEKAQKLITLAENTIKNIDSASITTKLRKRLGYRKIKTKGFFENDKKIYEKKIKYNKYGFKKEIIKVYLNKYINNSTIQKDVKLEMIIVKINDKIHYVKLYNFLKDSLDNMYVISREIYSNNNYIEIWNK